MKVIFLDFDGVLNSMPWIQEMWKQRNSHAVFNTVVPEHVGHLNDLIRRSGAKVVVSSTWRLHHPLDTPDHRGKRTLKMILEEAGFKGELIGRTPYGYKGLEGLEGLSDQRLVRGHEIQAWINKWHQSNPLIESFVILDDDDDMAHLRHRLVQTDLNKGLTAEDAKAALEILAMPCTES